MAEDTNSSTALVPSGDSSRFSVGDAVRVRAGVIDPDFPDIPLDGWAGVIAECDETANCGPSESCCLTSVRAYGLETRCNGGACGGRGWQSCRTNAECPTGETCVAWTCAGRTVATCNGFGSDAGCN